MLADAQSAFHWTLMMIAAVSLWHVATDCGRHVCTVRMHYDARVEGEGKRDRRRDSADCNDYFIARYATIRQETETVAELTTNVSC